MVGYKLSKNDWVTPFFVIFRSVREILLVTVFFDHPVWMSVKYSLYSHSGHIEYQQQLLGLRALPNCASLLLCPPGSRSWLCSRTPLWRGFPGFQEDKNLQAVTLDICKFRWDNLNLAENWPYSILTIEINSLTSAVGWNLTIETLSPCAANVFFGSFSWNMNKESHFCEHKGSVNQNQNINYIGLG